MADSDVADWIDPARTALVVVDVQRAFASEESPLAGESDLSTSIATVPRVAELVELARELELVVAFTRSVRRADGADDPAEVYDVVPGIYAGDTGPLCRAGAPDTAYVEGVEPRPGEYEVEKKRYDAFHGTPLDFYLRSEGVDTLLVCGFATDVCVEGTARGAHERGYDAVLVSDCCASSTEERHRTAIEFFGRNLGGVASLDGVREALAVVQ